MIPELWPADWKHRDKRRLTVSLFLLFTGGRTAGRKKKWGEKEREEGNKSGDWRVWDGNLP